MRGFSIASASLLALTGVAVAQDSWRPERISANSQARPLAASQHVSGQHNTGRTAVGHVGNSSAAQASTAEDLGGGVGLRWKPARRTAATPSRPRSAVHAAAYQQQGNAFSDPFGGNQPQLPPLNQLPDFPPHELPAAPPTQPMQDPLAEPELPPPPVEDPSDNLLGEMPPQDPSPFDRPAEDISDELPLLNDEPPTDDQLLEELPGIRSPRRAGLESCNELRDRIRSFPINEIDLDVSPSYGVGLRAYDDERGERSESQRRQFVETLAARQWLDYLGREVAYGRLLDLRDDRVIVDAEGVEKVIPIHDLSDLDVAYVGSAWNIPTRCGVGYEPFEGRSFVASTVQWTAPGLCHKPLYFEQVQLERYGHELGPILQPIVSSAHFFGSIAVLPYKAGIHPPNECQYALGYYRPGDCAPYMLQPIPWSLRGGLTQAAAVTGAAALIP